MLDQRKQIKHKTVIKSRRVRRTRRAKIPWLCQLEGQKETPATLHPQVHYILATITAFIKGCKALARQSLNKACIVHTRTDI